MFSGSGDFFKFWEVSDSEIVYRKRCKIGHTRNRTLIGNRIRIIILYEADIIVTLGQKDGGLLNLVHGRR